MITQNVDGLHQRAGSNHVVEIHGNAGRTICTRCSATYVTEKIVDRIAQQDVPRCDKCGGSLKPDVVLFGEPLQESAFDQALKKLKSANLLLVVGTSVRDVFLNLLKSLLPLTRALSGPQASFARTSP